MYPLVCPDKTFHIVALGSFEEYAAALYRFAGQRQLGDGSGLVFGFSGVDIEGGYFQVRRDPGVCDLQAAICGVDRGTVDGWGGMDGGGFFLGGDGQCGVCRGAVNG